MDQPKHVQRALAATVAYGNGDVAPTFEMLSENVSWISHGTQELPWAGTYEGPDGVRDYLERLGSAVEIRSYEVKQTVHQDEWVLNLASVVVLHKKSGAEHRYQKVDELRFAGDELVRFEEFFDTATAMKLEAVG